jgi:hypothetical protein
MASASLIRLVPPGGPKYQRLRNHLAGQLATVTRIEMSFGWVIVIISDQLPKSAWLHRAWWANDPTHIQAKAWLEAGWETTNVRMEERMLTFVRRR